LISATTPTPMGAVSDKTCSSTRDEQTSLNAGTLVQYP
jgi:hypothetical protein